MLVTELIRAFEPTIRLPVDVNDVLQKLRQSGLDDDIEFVGVDLDPDILQGKIKVTNIRNGVYGSDTKRLANIYYHRGHPIDWQRMICCKELIHLLDPRSAQTNRGDDIDRLAEKIGLPPEMQDPGSDGLATNIDRMAEFRAAAILLPFTARDILMPAFKSGEMSIAEIAILADIPRKYVGFVMHEVWDHVYPLLTSEA